MSETNEESAAFRIAIGLAFTGGYADAASFLLAHTFTGHLTGNCILVQRYIDFLVVRMRLSVWA
jgi:uncharacterized membrane protein YoaK (UPF0700 family)